MGDTPLLKRTASRAHCGEGTTALSHRIGSVSRTCLVAPLVDRHDFVDVIPKRTHSSNNPNEVCTGRRFVCLYVADGCYTVPGDYTRQLQGMAFYVHARRVETDAGDDPLRDAFSNRVPNLREPRLVPRPAVELDNSPSTEAVCKIVGGDTLGKDAAFRNLGRTAQGLLVLTGPNSGAARSRRSRDTPRTPKPRRRQHGAP